MREGSSANKYGNVMLTHTHRQPLSEENALAMQHQDESLLAAQMSHAHLSEDHQPQSDDVGRTDSKRGVRGAMAPKHSSAANVTGEELRLPGSAELCHPPWLACLDASVSIFCLVGHVRLSFHVMIKSL